MHTRYALVPLLFLSLATSGCEDDELITVSGILEIEVRNIRPDATKLTAEVQPEGGEIFVQNVDVVRPSTFVTFNDLPPGKSTVKVVGLSNGSALDSVTVHGILIIIDKVSRIVIDFELIIQPTPEEVCNGLDDDNDGYIDEGVGVLCGICQADESVILAEDDPICGEIPCDALNAYTSSGDNNASGYSECHVDRFPPLLDNRCKAVGECREAHDATVCGPASRSLEMSAALCHTISGCEGQTPPTLVISPNGTPCGPDDICQDGVCVPDTPPADLIGCSDGEREGFTDRNTFPNIAGCSGGWSVPGVRSTLSPACNRGAGDDSSNPTGNGCNVADLCSPGWHVCLDKEDVAASSPSGCDGSVPAGTQPNELLFITRQRSVNNVICEDRAANIGVNDIFGCGNLGTTLDASKNCSPLNRALASQHDDSCDFNEAEPPLGTWECGASSIHESENVTKQGPAKGGVVCCR